MRKLFALLFVAVLAAGGWLAWALWWPLAPAGRKSVLLRSGYTTRRIANELKSAGVIRSADAFILWHYLHQGRSLKAGEYVFAIRTSAIEIHDRILNGDINIHTVTIPEGFTQFDIASAVEEAGLGSSEEFLKEARSDTGLISDLAPGATSLEGYLFPDTYQFTSTQSMRDIAATMVRRFRKEAQAIGLSSDLPRLVTMASIVEKETALAEERTMVASVYYNRLGKRIALDADPCVIYAHLLAGTYKGSLHHDDLQIKSPYNTYRNPGLPPGPIANPGRGALEAALHPATTSYYYFVSDGEGHHRFAHSLDEHNQNVVKLRRTLAGLR